MVSLTGGEVKQVLLDTKPIPVIGNKRSKRHSDLAGSTAYGYGAARNLNYFGYKLVMLTDLAGLPLVYDLVPANLDERQAAESVPWRVCDCAVFGDKGFLRQDWQAEMRQQACGVEKLRLTLTMTSNGSEERAMLVSHYLTSEN